MTNEKEMKSQRLDGNNDLNDLFFIFELYFL